MKILIPILTVILVISGCSKKDQFTTPENATLILLCSTRIQTNEETRAIFKNKDDITGGIGFKLDEIIKGEFDPEFLDESNLIKGYVHPYFENLNVPSKYFIFARKKVNPPDVEYFRLKYRSSALPVYDEGILEHKNDIQFIQKEFERQMDLRGDINFPSEEEMKRFIEEHEKSRTSG